jgi:hypothetical protein
MQREKKSTLIDRKTISVFLRLWFEQQHNKGISNFSRPLSIISQGWTFVESEKKERERERDMIISARTSHGSLINARWVNSISGYGNDICCVSTQSYSIEYRRQTFHILDYHK